MARKLIQIQRSYGDTWGVSLTRIVINDYSSPFVGSVEVTCLPEEEKTIVAWARANWGRAYASSLPLAEYTRAPWGREYRWTMAAERLYRAATSRAA